MDFVLILIGGLILYILRVCLVFFVIHLGSLSAQPNQVLNDQPPELGWYRGYGTDAGDHVHYGMQTSDGG